MPEVNDVERGTWLRALRILETLVSSPEPLVLERVAELAALPKATAHRLLQELTAAGFLLREPRPKTYGVGPRLAALGLDSVVNGAWRVERRAILERLVSEIGETCNFTMLDGTVVRYIERVEAEWPLRLVLKPGSSVPLHCTSSGKLFMSFMPARLRRRLLFDAPIKRYTAKTITDPHQLERELKQIRKDKLATDDGGFLAGLISVAVPVLETQGGVVAAVAVHAPSARLSLRKALGFAPLLRQAGRELADLVQPAAATPADGVFGSDNRHDQTETRPEN